MYERFGVLAEVNGDPYFPLILPAGSLFRQFTAPCENTITFHIRHWLWIAQTMMGRIGIRREPDSVSSARWRQGYIAKSEPFSKNIFQIVERRIMKKPSQFYLSYDFRMPTWSQHAV